MKEYFVAVAMADGSMECFVTHPEQGGPFPAILMCMDVFGLREELFDAARRLATTGYFVIVPDFYYRLGRIRLSFPEGRWTFADIGPEQQQRVRHAGKILDDLAAMPDVGSLLQFLARDDVRPGAKGVLGFCMGGRLALCAGAHYPEHFRVTAGLHPSSLVSERPASPHLMAGHFRGEVYCGFPEDDPLAPTSTIETLQKMFSTASAAYSFNRHHGAVHGYALPCREMHNKQAANRDWEIIFAMLRRQVPR
jgi:carboxymethylenebutenolidase